MTKPLTIGQLAKQAGIGIETIRYYERQGLIDEPARLASGYRQFEPEAVVRLRFIRRAKDLGFTLREIKELLALNSDPDTRCSQVKERTQDKIADIQGKIHTLSAMQDALEKLVASCDSKCVISQCPILECFESEITK